MDAITESTKVAFNNMGIQLISYAFIIAIAYVVPYLLLSAVKVPIGLRKFVSAIAALFGMYYGFMEIFIP